MVNAIALVTLLLGQADDSLARDLALANDPEQPAVMFQAIDKLHARGAAAVPAIVDFVSAHGARKLSLAFTDGLGGFDDDRIAALCGALVDDPDFFWRPAAMRSLAALARPAHRDRFRKGLTDRLWGVRAAAAQGIAAIGDKESAPELRKLLADEIYDVRGAAAKALHGFGDDSGLPVLVEALRQETYWFDVDYGQLAREDSWNFLRTLSNDDFGFKPWESKEERAPGLARWDAWMDARDPEWRGKVPVTARARDDRATYRFGLELRSCQKGDFFLRVDDDGNLVLGCYNVQRAPLAAEERADFDRALAKALAVDRAYPYGRGGCDFEEYRLPVAGGGLEKLWIGLEGRPAEMEPFTAALRRLIDAKFGAATAADFAEKAGLFRGVE